MDRIPNTPPDGDFARYVEELSASSAAALARQAKADSSTGKSPEGPAAPRAAAAGPGRPPSAGPSLWTVGRWVLMAWIALQLLSVLVPRIGMFSVPLLLAFAGWAIYRFKKSPQQLLTGRLREWAEQAAREFKQGK